MKRKLELSGYRAISLGSLHETLFVKLEYGGSLFGGSSAEELTEQLRDSQSFYAELAEWIKSKGGSVEDHR